MRRLFFLVPCVCLIGPPALAQSTPSDFDAAAAVRGFLTDATLLGADSATVGSITTDGNVITAQDIAMNWSVTLTAMGESITVNAGVEIASARIEGLAPHESGHGADQILVPESKLSIAVEGADQPFSYTLSMRGYEIKDGRWRTFPVITADAEKPLSRFAPLVDWSFDWSWSRYAVEQAADALIINGDLQESTYGLMEVGAAENGRIAVIEIPALKSTQSAEAVRLDGSSQPLEMTTEYAATTLRGLDFIPFAALLTGSGDYTGPVTMIESAVMDGGSLTGDDMLTMSSGPMSYEGMSVDPTRGPLLEKWDSVVVKFIGGVEPEPSEVIDLTLDFYGAFGIARQAFTDLEFATPEASGRMASFVTEDLDRGGLGRFAIEGVSFQAPSQKGQLELLEFRDLEFPDKDAFISVIAASMANEAPGPAALAAIPRLGAFALRGLNVETGMPGLAPINLDTLELNLDDYIGAIPSRLGVVIEGLQIPAALLPNPQATSILGLLGADPVRADGAITLSWAEDTGAITLDENLTIAGIGQLRASANVSGIPRAIFDNPTRAQEAIATASIGDISLRFDDGGITPFMLGMMAEQSGIGAAEFAAGLTQQVEAQIEGILGARGLASEVGAALRTYLNDPQNITIAATPANPVPVAQLIGAAMAAPAQIAGILNLSITANE